MSPYLGIDDTALLDLLNTGDEKAFEAIYNKYLPGMFRFVNKNIASKEDCEEILQDIFESLWRRRMDLAEIASLQAYLFTMAKYKAIRYFQHKAVRKRYNEHFRLFEAVYETFSEEERSSESMHEKILSTMAQLPERCQLAVRLRLMENLSNEDIAKKMNIKKDTVENYMVTAVSYLRDNLGSLYKTGG